MITLRRSNERGHFNHGWLETFHTFSFAQYRDANQMGFRSLRVINEDTVAAGKGFGTHPHANMEILTYVLQGSLSHKDSLGTGSTIVPGEIQRMSAGTGIEHSEFNTSTTEPLHLLQIWILPQAPGVRPSYEQKKISYRNGKALIASPAGQEGVKIGQDAWVWSFRLAAGQETPLTLAHRRFGWVQVARGSVDLAEFEMHAGDGASLTETAQVDLHAKTDTELLFFDLA